MPTGAEIELTVAGSSALAGKVRYDDGRPVRSFSISFAKYARAYGEEAFAPGHPVESADGSFRIDEVPADSYGLEIRGPSLVTRRLPGPIRVHGEVTDLGTIEVTRGQQREGFVRLPGGGPAAGAKVHLDGGSDATLALQVAGARGEFIVPAVAAGTTLRVRAELDKLAAPWKTAAADGPVEIDLGPGGLGVVTGVMIDSGPVADRRVLLTAPGGTAAEALSPVVASAVCDAAGRFKLVDVAAGSYTLRAQRAGSSEWKLIEGVAVEPQKETTLVIDMQGSP